MASSSSADLGVERVILARELSLSEISTVRQGVDLPVEVFVHGALCVAYSGQCLTSEALGGRSANRGQCAQACRLPYELIVDGEKRDLGEYAYLLSPQDLAGHELVGELVKLGVCSLKIEGRLKSAQYVAATTRTYRAALDAARESRPFTLDRPMQLDLSQSFSRGFTPGFLAGVDHQRLVHGRFPKSRGVRVGAVVAKTGRGVLIELAEEHRAAEQLAAVIKPGDGVVFDEGHPEQDEQGGRVFEVTPRRGSEALRVELTFGHGAVNFSALSPGCLVWKTDDPDFRKRMDRTYARDAKPRRCADFFAPRPHRRLAAFDRLRRSAARSYCRVGRSAGAGAQASAFDRYGSRAARPAGRYAVRTGRRRAADRRTGHGSQERAQRPAATGRSGTDGNSPGRPRAQKS